MYWINFPAEGERNTDGSFSFSNTQVLLPIVMRYLGGKWEYINYKALKI
jgi:hypothetical protein